MTSQIHDATVLHDRITQHWMRQGVLRMMIAHLPDDNQWHNLVVRARRNGDTVDMAGNHIQTRND